MGEKHCPGFDFHWLWQRVDFVALFCLHTVFLPSSDTAYYNQALFYFFFSFSIIIMTLPSLGLLLICVPVCVSGSGACPQLLHHHHKGWKKWQQKRDGMDVWNWRSDLHHCRWMEQGREGKGRVGSGRVMNCSIGFGSPRLLLLLQDKKKGGPLSALHWHFSFCVLLFQPPFFSFCPSFSCHSAARTSLLLLLLLLLPFMSWLGLQAWFFFLIFSSLAAAAHPVPSGLLVWYYFSLPFLSFPHFLFSCHSTQSLSTVCVSAVLCCMLSGKLRDSESLNY